MSEESTDSDAVHSNTSQSRSILRQVRDTLGAVNRNRHRPEIASEPPPPQLINTKRASLDHIDSDDSHGKARTRKSPRSTTPVSFTSRLTLLDQVKLHMNKNRKCPATASSSSNETDEYIHLSLSPMVSLAESKSFSPFDETQNAGSHETDSLASDVFVEPTAHRLDHAQPIRQSSLDMLTCDDDQQPRGQLSNEATRTLSSSRISLNKFRDQFTHRSRPTLNRSPSLSSVLTNTSLPNNTTDQVYWVELYIERGKDLAVKDINGTSDPYVKVYHETEEKHTTSTVYKSLNPIWNEKISFLVHDLNTTISFYVFDYDRIGRDEPMGTAKIDLYKLPVESPYSATLNLENEKRTDGKTGMLHISITITPKTGEFRDEVLRSMAKQSNPKGTVNARMGISAVAILTRRKIDVFIIEGRNLTGVGSDKRSSSPYVRLRFGNHKKHRTQTVKSTGNPKWHQSFMYDIFTNELPPLELTVIDDTGGSGDFMSRGICNLAHLAEEQTHRISVDLDDHAGVIDLFVTITGTNPTQEAANESDNSSNTVLDFIPSKLTDDDIERYTSYASLRSIQPIFDVGKVEIKIYQARDLSAKDMNGKSDPFCVIELDSTRLRTHTIYKTLDPIWNKSFIIPVQDIHSVLELTIFDEDMNKSPEFIGKVVIPLLAINNGEKKWLSLKDRKCVLPVKGIVEIEATLIYTNVKAIIRTFNPRQVRYYQQDGKFRVGVFKQHINRVRNMLVGVVNLFKFINYCFQWENPLLSFCAFIISLLAVWNFELYMVPCALLCLFARYALIEYHRGRLGTPFSTLGDETLSAVVQPMNMEDDVLDSDGSIKEQKKSLMGVIHSVQEAVLEVQGYVDETASTLERIKNLFNFTVPWLSVLAIVVLAIVSVVLYHIPLRYLLLAFIINKFTKRFRKPKDYIDNNELADFISRLPSDPELLQYRETKILSRISSPKKAKR